MGFLLNLFTVLLVLTILYLTFHCRVAILWRGEVVYTDEQVRQEFAKHRQEIRQQAQETE